jgi:DNA-binding Lrp family transcriptional regulator
VGAVIGHHQGIGPARVSGDSDADSCRIRFETAIHDVPDIVVASRMMGQPDYLLRVAVPDADEFESLYMDTLARLPGVKTLTSQTAIHDVPRR